MVETENKSILAIEVTETQRETIRHLFAHNEWELNEVPIRENEAQVQENQNDEDVQDFVINQNVEEEECIYCLCRPCISSEKNRQMWWLEDPVAPNRSNSQRRKDIYKRFWTMLFHRNVWIDPRYIERKRNALRQDPQRKNYIFHRRDLMPKCVVSKVRFWLPNLNEQPYMGHMWE